jgi:exosortase
MVDRWTEEESYYNHGFLVPLISIFLIWLNKEKILRIKAQPDNLGWAFFIPGVLIHTLSSLWQIFFTSGFSLILVIVGLVLLFWGRRQLKQLSFPILFLIFMIPLPLVAVADISFRLKIFVTQISTILINKIGIPAIREGSIIKTAHSYLIVEDPCSGIRSLIAMIALGALMAYFLTSSRLKKIILFFSAVPVAICSNIIRIIILLSISEIYGTKYITGVIHGVMGILVFVFSFLGLVLVGRILK